MFSVEMKCGSFNLWNIKYVTGLIKAERVLSPFFVISVFLVFYVIFFCFVWVQMVTVSLDCPFLAKLK